MHNFIVYESNDETTIGRQGGRDGEDADELVPTIPHGTGADGTEAGHEGDAAAHCEMDSRQVLHRFGNVVTRLATFFRDFIVHYAALSVQACTKRKSRSWNVVPLQMSGRYPDGEPEMSKSHGSKFFTLHF